jgi:hypothetical protein
MQPAGPNGTVSPPVQVFVSKEFRGNAVRYHYRVANGSAFPIAGLAIGYSPDVDNLQLNLAPSGWNAETKSTPDTSFAGPSGWSFEVTSAEEDSVGMVEWRSEDSTKAIWGGESANTFFVTLPRDDPPYEHGIWTAFLAIGDATHYTGTLRPEDPGARSARTSLDSGTGVTSFLDSSRKGARIVFSLPPNLSYAVSIFNAHGYLVRFVTNGVSNSATTSLHWNGRDTEGRHVPPGTYFIQVTSGTDERFGRLVFPR